MFNNKIIRIFWISSFKSFTCEHMRVALSIAENGMFLKMCRGCASKTGGWGVRCVWGVWINPWCQDSVLTSNLFYLALSFVSQNLLKLQ